MMLVSVNKVIYCSIHTSLRYIKDEKHNHCYRAHLSQYIIILGQSFMTLTLVCNIFNKESNTGQITF